MTGVIPRWRAFVAVDVAAGLDAIEPTIAAAADRRVRGWMLAGEHDVVVRRCQRASTPSSSVVGSTAGWRWFRRPDAWYPVDFAARLSRALDFVTGATPE